MVPVTALIALWGLYSIHHSRLKAETKSNIKEEAAPQETMTPEQQAEAAKHAAEEKQAIENKFKNIIKPLLRPEYRRLYMIYLPYGIVQSIIIGQIAGLTLDKAALFVTLTGSLVSWLVRKGSTKLIKNGKITEDQLTGFMLPLMAISYIGLFLSPFDLSMTANSIPLLLSILGAYISTPALGTVENTRMLNKTVDYYNSLRVQIEENPNLTPEEKKIQIAKLNKELASMKTRTSTHYNNGNASALWPVIGLAAIAVALIGLGNDAEHIPAFSQKYLPMIADYLGGVKAEGIEAITKLSFFKIFLSIAAGLATATFVSNMSLIKSVFSSNKVKISQDMINNNEITAETLKLDENMQQNVVDIVKDIESLSKDLKLRRLSLSSEAQVNDWLQKAIYINNRVRYLQVNNPDSYAQLGKSIEMFTKEALPNLKIIVEQVAVSNNKYALPRKKQVLQYSQNFMVQYDNLMESKCKKYIEQGVLPAVNTLHFERALIIRNGLIDLTEKKAAGDVYEGMEEDFEGLYESALDEISLYEKKNKFNYSEPRVTTFKKQLNSIREIFFADKE
ncbi:MAG: hypothetical protein K6E94_04690 [Elusimicrobiaceae bacterium]|nr:hypothetical protein [Elusimicrobiaceae bacterium]